jgi:hypothetical protein
MNTWKDVKKLIKQELKNNKLQESKKPIDEKWWWNYDKCGKCGACTATMPDGTIANYKCCCGDSGAQCTSRWDCPKPKSSSSGQLSADDDLKKGVGSPVTINGVTGTVKTVGGNEDTAIDVKKSKGDVSGQIAGGGGEEDCVPPDWWSAILGQCMDGGDKIGTVDQEINEEKTCQEMGFTPCPSGQGCDDGPCTCDASSFGGPVSPGIWSCEDGVCDCGGGASIAVGGKSKHISADDDDRETDDARPPKKKSDLKAPPVDEATITAQDTKFNLRTGVNKNPTKLGIKIQFEPMGGMLTPEVKAKLEVALQEKLNLSLAEYDIQVSKDTDVPRDEVIGFFIPLSQIKNLIVKSITGESVPKPTVPAPEPESVPAPAPAPDPNNEPGAVPVEELKMINQMIGEHLLKEMRVRDLNEASKIVVKEDFYSLINAGNNILRTFEDNGKSANDAKRYIKYLVAHNIM